MRSAIEREREGGGRSIMVVVVKCRWFVETRPEW